MNVRDAINRLAEEERDFRKREFLAPRMRGQRIGLYLNGVRCSFRVYPHDFQGWGVFRPRTWKAADFVRDATMTERDCYLELFPSVWVILCQKTDDGWIGMVQGGQYRPKGMIPIRFAENGQLFDLVKVRWDGVNFWTDRILGGITADKLRENLVRDVSAEDLDLKNLHPVERQVYEAHYKAKRAALAESQRDRTQERLKRALEHAGAVLQSYREQDDSLVVQYQVDGAGHTSVLAKDTLQVQAAGICLAGTDGNFDLGSLVCVVREGQEHRRIVRVPLNNPRYGHERDEEDWDD